MKTTMLMAGAAMLAFGGAAIAQEVAPTTGVQGSPPMSDASPPANESAAPADMSAPSSATTAAPTTATDPAASGTPMASQTPAAMPATPGTPAADPAKLASAQQTVQQGWATYAKDNKGALTPLEFGKWVMAAQGQDLTAQIDKTRQSRSANLPAVKVLNATAAAFSQADTNKDRSIQPEELTSFLAQG